MEISQPMEISQNLPPANIPPAILPSPILLDGDLVRWLQEDIGRGDRTSQSIFPVGASPGQASWIAKQTGVVAGLPIAKRVFELVNREIEVQLGKDGTSCQPGQVLLTLQGPMDGLLMGERVALNLTMRLSGIATVTRQYVDQIADLPTRFVDTRKTTPGLRILEKYASQVGGALNHRMGLDDAVMIKDNHIVAAGGIAQAIARVRQAMPYPLTVEVETESLEQVQQALDHGADIIMLDNMALDIMAEAVALIRRVQPRTRIEASGNVSLETIRAIALTGVDYISSSGPITRSPWLDISMRFS
jgi:nicotinate-nucleotide pyrophosphorylase (carboxylating)